MKLNIGCGYAYLQGYLNVDASGDSLADAIMEAHDLRLEAASVDEIVASQLIEHLGFFKGKYFLAECFRVLKPGGTLRLETPHLESTFDIFCAGDRIAREYALTWLYGAETTGMEHRFCFPVELLQELTAAAGFDLIHHTSFSYQKHRPSLRLLLRKPGNRPDCEFMAELRKRLVVQSIPIFDNEVDSAGQEALLGRLASAWSAAPVDALQLAVHSAAIVREFFSLKHEYDGGAEVAKCHAVAAHLARIRFQEILLDRLKDRPEGAGRQAEAWQGVLREGHAIITALFSGEKLEFSAPAGGAVLAFTEPFLKSVAEKLFARGCKAFWRKEYAQALDRFGESARIFRDNPFTWWNMARLHALQHDAGPARAHYAAVQAVLDVVPHEANDVYRAVLTAEMHGIPPQRPVAVNAMEGEQ